jgi:RNA recognition motif-containing protein
MEIYVGNLLHALTEEELKQVFGTYGSVGRVSIVKDKVTGMSRGFGFVHMDNQDEAAAAISALNGSDLKGRAMTVNEARPRAPRTNDRGASRPYSRPSSFGGGREQGGRGDFGGRERRDRNRY